MKVVSADWVVPVEGEPIRDGAVAIGDDGKVERIGPQSELGEGEHFAGSVVLPGFVNAHTHLEYSAYAGFGDGLPFADWISLHVRRKGLLTFDDMVALARVGAAECLRTGVTTVADASFSGAAACAVDELGLRGTVYLEVFGRDASALLRFEESRDKAGAAFSDRVRLGVSPHAPYTCTLEVYEACAALELPVTTHLSESAQELEYLHTGGGGWAPFAELLVPPPGDTGTRMLAEAGLLGPHVVAAHCVLVDSEEIAMLAEHGVGVAHCPRSNAYLGCGIAPLQELREAGVHVGIATDSPASTPSFDLFAEMRAAIELARVRQHDTTALSATDALELATLGGARTLGVDADVGSLVPNKQADLVVLSIAGSAFDPVEDPVVAAVLGGSPDRVLATLVGGEERYRKGKTDWRDLTSRGRSARNRMLR